MVPKLRSSAQTPRRGGRAIWAVVKALDGLRIHPQMAWSNCKVRSAYVGWGARRRCGRGGGPVSTHSRFAVVAGGGAELVQDLAFGRSGGLGVAQPDCEDVLALGSWAHRKAPRKRSIFGNGFRGATIGPWVTFLAARFGSVKSFVYFPSREDVPATAYSGNA